MKYILFQTGGSIQGALNYYRTTKLRFEEEQAGKPTISLTTSPEFTPPLSQLPTSRSHTRQAYRFSTSGGRTTPQAQNQPPRPCARSYHGERSSLTRAPDTGSCYRGRTR